MRSGRILIWIKQNGVIPSPKQIPSTLSRSRVQAIDILRELHPLTGRGSYVFPEHAARSGQ